MVTDFNPYFIMPAEWSEEDKRKLNRIYEILGHAADDKGFLTSKRIIGDKEAIELQVFLKSLRPSQKLNEEEIKKIRSEEYTKGFNDAAFGGKEWSVEDERMLRTIISDGSRGVELDSKQISWLKSLRPQPKQERSED